MLNVPCQCVILQGTDHYCFLYVFISDPLRFPYDLYHEPKLVWILISHSLDIGNFIVLAILNRGGGGGGMGEVGGEDGETGGGVGGGGMCEIICLIRLITLLGETFMSSSLPPCGGEIKGLVSSSVLPSFL